MKVSIIMPTFNSEKTIEKAAQSIIDQNYPLIEYIVVDNMSSDKTIDIIDSLFTRSTIKPIVISERDKGISDAFNKGIRVASGDIIAILNSDDFYIEPDVVNKVVEAFRPGVYFVYSSIKYLDLEFGSHIREPGLWDIRKAYPFHHPSLFAHSMLYQDYGLYDLDYKLVMDYEFTMRFYDDFKRGKIKGQYVSGPLVCFSAEGVSNKMEKKTLDEIKRALVKNKHYDFFARVNLFLRQIRILLKEAFSSIGLDIIINKWRLYKWRRGK